MTDGLPLASVADDSRAGRERSAPAARALRETRPQWDAGQQAMPEPYTRANFLVDTCLTEETADELHDPLREKRQIIPYGPPGTGKTHAARRLGRWLTAG